MQEEYGSLLSVQARSLANGCLQGDLRQKLIDEAMAQQHIKDLEHAFQLSVTV